VVKFDCFFQPKKGQFCEQREKNLKFIGVFGAHDPQGAAAPQPQKARQRLAPSRFLRIKNTAMHKNMHLRRRNVLRLAFQHRRGKQQ
jgi:hypothetical protein